jgi:hypothetical protein
MSYPASDPHAEPPTAIFPAGVYRSSEVYPAAPADPYPDPPPTGPVELSPEALRRLRARLVRKYH